jgi:hypothetical protein
MSTPTKDNFLKSIGEICVSFSRLELYLSRYIGDFISGDIELNGTIVAGESFNTLLILFESLFRYRIKNKRTLKRVAKLVSRLAKINSDRNKIVHSDWFFAKYKRRFIVKRTLTNKRNYKRLVFDMEMPRITSLRKLSKQIQVETRRLILLMEYLCPTIKEHREKTSNQNVMEVYTKQRIAFEKKHPNINIRTTNWRSGRQLGATQT